MKNRREFLKNAATGAMLIGPQCNLSFAELLGQYAKGKQSRVVVARDATLHDPSGRIDEKRVIDLLDRSIVAFTGRDHPIDGWKRIVPRDTVIGLKVNTVGLKPISTHLTLVLAVAERLQQAGVRAGNILVWDRTAGELEAGGFTINTDPKRVRCFGSDVAGFEDKIETWGVARVRLSKILTRECGMVLNLPVLKDHAGAGITFAMKNMYGVIDMVGRDALHSACCNPGIADLNSIPAIRNKVRFTIGDAMSALYEGGPLFRPEHVWHANALIVGQDPVAIDQTGWLIIERKRAEVGFPTLEAAGRAPRYISTAADSAHQLGTNDPRQIALYEI